MSHYKRGWHLESSALMNIWKSWVIFHRNKWLNFEMSAFSDREDPSNINYLPGQRLHDCYEGNYDKLIYTKGAWNVLILYRPSLLSPQGQHWIKQIRAEIIWLIKSSDYVWTLLAKMCESALKVFGLSWKMRMNHLKMPGTAVLWWEDSKLLLPAPVEVLKHQVAVSFASVLNIARLINLPFN